MIVWDGMGIAVVSSKVAVCPNIEDLYVTPQRRHQGIGSEIISHEETLTMERGIGLMRLAVGKDNPRAATLYRRLDFKVTGLGELVIDVRYTDAEGRLRTGEEMCRYLIKSLGEYEPC